MAVAALARIGWGETLGPRQGWHLGGAIVRELRGTTCRCRNYCDRGALFVDKLASEFMIVQEELIHHAELVLLCQCVGARYHRDGVVINNLSSESIKLSLLVIDTNVISAER